MSASVLLFTDPAIAARPAHPDMIFYCPGCKCGHGVWTSKPANNGARWAWNGDKVKPTFSPSILITIGNGPDVSRQVCHSFVRDGQIEFLPDCTHALAGQTHQLKAL